MDEHASVFLVVRDLGVAWRALRLYPSGSPLSQQAAEAVCKAVEEHLSAEPSLKLVVVREGFLLRGVERVFTSPGVPDLADALGAHSIAELTFVAPPDPEEVLAFLDAAREQPKDIQDRGGLQTVLNGEHVATIRLVPVALANAEAALEIPEDEADTFLAKLAADPTRLAMWLRALLTYDDEGLAEGLIELCNAAGDATTFGASLARAFLELDCEGTDRLLEVSMYLEPVLPITNVMLANLSTVELVAAIRGGRYGQNPVSLSWALTGLPLGERAEALIDDTAAALASADVPAERIELMKRLIAARRRGEPEPPLSDVEPIYASALDACKLQPEHLDYLRNEAETRRRAEGTTIAAILRLLELADELEAFSRVLGALARAVPAQFEAGDPELAMVIARKIARREVATGKPWPELDEHLVRAVEEACGARAVTAVLTRFGAEPRGVEYVKEIVSLGGERAALGVADAVMASEDESHMAIAHEVLGRRLPEFLAVKVGAAEAHNVGRLAALFATDCSAVSLQALQHLVSRTEDKIRAECARGVCAAGGDCVGRFMPRLLRDTAREVELVSVRAMARRGDEQAVRMLGERLLEFDDDKDLIPAREIITALAPSPSEAAGDALKRFAEGGGLFGKRKSSEMRQLAKKALQARNERGGG